MPFDINTLSAAVQVALGMLAWLFPRGSRPARHTPTNFHVEPITDPGTNEFEQAMKLYRRRFSSSERATPEDMMRWIREDSRRKGDPFRPRDLFLVAVENGTVLGFLNFTWYPTSRHAFISYLATANPRRTLRSEGVSASLVAVARDFLERQLVRCAGVVMEVDAPEQASTRKERSRRRARIRLLAELAKIEGLSLRIMDTEYVAPRPHSLGRETPMLLLYARLGDKSDSATISHKKAGKILRFVYQQVYGDSFANDKKMDAEYRQYVNAMFERRMEALRNKESVALIDPLGRP